jgi:hypothetical protein
LDGYLNIYQGEKEIGIIILTELNEEQVKARHREFKIGLESLDI